MSAGKADLKALYAELDRACIAVEAVRTELGRVSGRIPSAVYGAVNRDTDAAKRLLAGAVLKLIAAEDQPPR